MNQYLLVILVSFSSACVYNRIALQKGKLLDPLMDPAKTDGFYASFRGEPLKGVEHGGAGSNGSVGGSCPTCGG